MPDGRAVPQRSRWRALAPRAALLGGTTTLGDCAVGVRHLASPRLLDGPAIAAFEDEFARRVGVPHAVSFLAGRVALYGILRGLGIGPGDEVLLPVPTHIVVANAVRYTGARPVYVDCRPETYNMDLEQAEARITARTSALVLQHTFGIPADLDDAVTVCERHGLDLVEDCVHALGATFGGRPVGAFGRAAFFSTEETKTISTTTGGMAVTGDEGLAAALRAFRASCAPPPASLAAQHVVKLIAYHLLTQPRVHRLTRLLYEQLGRRQPLPGPTADEEARGERPEDYGRRLPNAHAALGLRQLRRLDANLRHRRLIADIYERRLRSAGVGLPAPAPTARAAYVRFPVSVPDREDAARAVSRHAVPGRWFSSVLEEAVEPAVGGYHAGECPTAEACAVRLVNLPTHPRVSFRQAHDIADALARAVPAAGRPWDAQPARTPTT
jgi:dTDP-4-amino-4,6-dideoxygalactose transaminase